MTYTINPLQVAKIVGSIRQNSSTLLALDFYKAVQYFNELTTEDRYAGQGHGLGDLVRIDLFVDSAKDYIVHVEFDALGKNAMFFRCDVSEGSDIVIQEVAL